MEYFRPDQLKWYVQTIERIKMLNMQISTSEQHIEEADHELIALKFAKSKGVFNQHLCATNVKIFNNVFDIYNLYKEELDLQQLLSLAQETGRKYYLLEICISKTITEKFSENWKLLVNLEKNDFNINRVIRLSVKSPLIEVIPVDENIIDCILNVKLFKHTKDGCLKMDINTVYIDVSYHFESYKESNQIPTFDEKLLNYTKQFEKEKLAAICKPIYLEYKVHSALSPQDFVKILLRNSYHRLDIELFSELTSSAPKAVNVAFSFRNNSRCIIMYDPEFKSIKLKCTADDMHLLKSYIFENVPLENYDNGIPNIPSMDIRAQLDGQVPTYEELKKSYEDYRKLVHQLPL